MNSKDMACVRERGKMGMGKVRRVGKYYMFQRKECYLKLLMNELERVKEDRNNVEKWKRRKGSKKGNKKMKEKKKRDG